MRWGSCEESDVGGKQTGGGSFGHPLSRGCPQLPSPHPGLAEKSVASPKGVVVALLLQTTLHFVKEMAPLPLAVWCSQRRLHFWPKHVQSGPASGLGEARLTRCTKSPRADNNPKRLQSCLMHFARLHAQRFSSFPEFPCRSVENVMALVGDLPPPDAMPPAAAPKPFSLPEQVRQLVVCPQVPLFRTAHRKKRPPKQCCCT